MLTQKIANEIVDETSIRLHRNINIMDIHGIIIATKDSSRIGLIHEGAKEVLITGDPLVIYPEDKNNWSVAQAGINLPIVFQDRTIGVIGITGNPHEVKELGALVKMTTELMIKQEFIAKQVEWRQRTKDMIIGELLKSSPSYRDIDQGLDLLQFNFKPPFLSIMIQISERSISNQTIIQLIEETIGTAHCFASFTNVNRLVLFICGYEDEKATMDSLHRIYQTIKKRKIKFRMAYSLLFYKRSKFQQSYLDCELTLKISDDHHDLVSFTNIEVKSFIYQLDENLTQRFMERVLTNSDNEVTSNTLQTFFTNHLNIQKAADALYVHRNTLIYRLNKIKEDTGYDPRNFEDALNLQVALWILNKKND